MNAPGAGIFWRELCCPKPWMHQVTTESINHQHSKLSRPHESPLLKPKPSTTVTQVTQQFTNKLQVEIKLDQ